MRSRDFYAPLIPQRPEDLKTSAMRNWSAPPINADYVAFGYTAVQDGRLVHFGWLYNLLQPDPNSAQVIGRMYFGSLDADGAKKAAREFAADILQQFGVKSLTNTKIYFASDRTGHKEIWAMDYDGSANIRLPDTKRSRACRPSPPTERRLRSIRFRTEPEKKFPIGRS